MVWYDDVRRGGVLYRCLARHDMRHHDETTTNDWRLAMFLVDERL